MDQTPLAAAPIATAYRRPRGDYSNWYWRLWSGMQVGPWLALLWRNRFAIGRNRSDMVLAITAITFVNSALALIQRAVFGRRIAATRLAANPVFVVGHWRSGTTFLHELMALDDRFCWPTTLDCFAPSHFLVSRPFRRLLARLAPTERPMDRMPIGVDRPQEDEWALLLLGLGSPYELIAFPNHRPAGREFLDLRDVRPAQLHRWQRGYRRFLQAVQLRAERSLAHAAGGGRPPRRLLLKSPTHTARLGVLCEMFPDASFVHLVRDPVDTFASTMKLWSTLFKMTACQSPRFDALPPATPSFEEYVLENLEVMYRSFERDAKELAPGRLCQVRFADLIRDPIGTVEGIYRNLNLGSFAAVRDRVAAYVAAVGMESETYALEPELAAEVRRRWGPHLDRYL